MVTKQIAVHSWASLLTSVVCRWNMHRCKAELMSQVVSSSRFFCSVGIALSYVSSDVKSYGLISQRIQYEVSGHNIVFRCCHRIQPCHICHLFTVKILRLEAQFSPTCTEAIIEVVLLLCSYITAQDADRRDNEVSLTPDNSPDNSAESSLPLC